MRSCTKSVAFYSDLDVELLVPLDYISHLASGAMLVGRTQTNGRAYNAVLGAPPGYNVFKNLVDYMAENSNEAYFNNLDYLTSYLKANTTRGFASEGMDTFKDGRRLLVLTEEFRDARECWDGKDFYGYCSFLTYNNEKLFKSRYADFFGWADQKEDMKDELPG